VCFDTQQYPMVLVIDDDKYFQSCHTSRAFQRVGFESQRYLHLSKGLGPYYEGDRQLAAQVRPLQSIRDFF
jgi:hypothetical protein